MHRRPATHAANIAAARRWLSLALHGHAATWGIDSAGEPLPRPQPPVWAVMLHAYGAWRVLAHKHLRTIYNDEALQSTLLAADRLGGKPAVLQMLAELFDGVAQRKR